MQSAREIPMQTPTEVGGAAAESMEYVLSMAKRLADKLRVIDFRNYEPLGADAAVTFMSRSAARQVHQSIVETIRLLASLPVLILGDSSAPAEAPVEDDDAWLGGDDLATAGTPSPLHDRIVEEIDAALTRLTESDGAERSLDRDVAVSTWKMLASQLRNCCDRLKAARRARSKWALITEGEDGRRKALKALQLGMTTAMRLAGYPAGVLAFPEDPAELQVALQVREALISLRRDLLNVTAEVEQSPDHELNITARDVRIRILELFLSPVYRDLRAADRYALQELRARVDAWLATSWDDTEAARRLLSDVRAFAGMLDQVNNRELLVTHDRRVLIRSLEAVDDLVSTLATTRKDGWLRYLRILRDAAILRSRSEAFARFLATELESSMQSGNALLRSVNEARELLAAIRV
ncbi:MAG: hypothetical protein HY903_13275 [Deltaproteobacteria bacterium]|nr:hypothetical protein [Deltaproteobacteria bacterium]